MSVLLEAEHHWECPSCTQQLVTTNPGLPMHCCAGLGGLTAPFVPAGTRAKHEAVDREDYLGSDIPQRDADGRVVMAIRTTRDEGEDCTVLAPTATSHWSDR